ncbi:hypothetical protein [Lentilactobacillus laojiaonis]|uniref:hypothetical protein n=1 Tax=Lentilactobacillus laojiaonis TaxID=2883998 RepID=UPI001D0A038C|nr:hypothetical protein [Lentilactobacillus laojiaonis]UDM32244.1 hypothetical protein LHL71_00465 [Lentilactobacillus laojiaonis]
MKHKLITTLALGLTVTGAGMLANQTKASASTKYVWTKTKSYKSTTPAYHAKKQGQTAYLWNWNHTKKLHNSKNYPHTTWHVQQSVAMKHGKKTTIYYQVVSGNKKVTGYIYRGYLTKGKYQAPSNNNNNSNNNNSNNINSDKYTDAYGVESYKSRDELKKTILSIFSGATEDPKLTSDADEAINLGLSSISEDGYIRDTWSNKYYDFIDSLDKKNDGKLISVNTFKALTDDVSYKDYILGKLNVKKINPDNYKGYKIGVSAVSKTEDDYDNYFGSAYGRFEILLVPND